MGFATDPLDKNNLYHPININTTKKYQLIEFLTLSLLKILMKEY